ncbi:helix-turn-helix domain-containing protein [Nocardia sp. 004]|uniref:helix-turn-helix domain-containing protein n=1 Tax=Nocardia sp. 004 TaxID=3385978 RepID=UPI00399FE47A
MIYCLMVPKMTDDAVRRRRIAFGKRLRTLRAEAGKSQAEVAAAAGTDRSFYVGVEAGYRNISIDKVFLIADALGVDVALLFSDLPGRADRTRMNS